MRKPKPTSAASDTQGSVFGAVLSAALPTVTTPVMSDSDDRVGYIDLFGYIEGLSGWFFIGWIRRPANIGRTRLVNAIAQFDAGSVGGRATVVFHQRDDLTAEDIGVVVFLPGTSRALGELADLLLQFDQEALRARAGELTQRTPQQELAGAVRSILSRNAYADANRMIMLRMMSRPLYLGEDTTATLPERILFGLDDMIICPPDGVLLIGWQLGSGKANYTLRLRSGQLTTEFNPADGVRLARPDVAASLGVQAGFTATDCGFMLFLPHAFSAGDTTFLEIETASGAVAFQTVKPATKRHIDAIRHILQLIDVRYDAVAPCFDNIVGPAIAAINRDRLRAAPTFTELAFGPAVETPDCSIIVPLYGRIDFIEYQMALFSRDTEHRYELIYVLDDPEQRRELQILAQSVYERFRLPFRLLLLHHNVGFAPANNVGLQAAQGRYVCFLNSDAFPKTPGWLARLTRRLEDQPEIGVIGPRLLYEDGSVQHEGCRFDVIAEFAGWNFLFHENKGRRPEARSGVRYYPVITGACMVMERTLADEIDGFDEEFIIGDFEDSDLCLKLAAMDRRAAVDFDVELYHLERKSQGTSNQNWRQNLTLYNSWVHQRRWFGDSPTALRTAN